MERVCFDHLSGTRLEGSVLEAMRPWLVENFAGASAVHGGGVRARKALENARRQAAQFVGATPEEIVFTSSGTEALNLALKGCALANHRRGKHIVLSATEHPAVIESVEFLKGQGFIGTVVGVSREGVIDPAEVKEALREDTILVCAHAANHDVGTVQDLAAIGEVAAEAGVPLLVDATYAGGWMSLDAGAMQASYLALAPHRFGGPRGTAILYKNKRARLAPLIHGGGQEHGYRAGAENIAGIVGAGEACAVAGEQIWLKVGKVGGLQSRMWDGIKAGVADVRLNGPEVGGRRLANLLNVSIAGLEGEGLALNLDMKGFEITAGAACAAKDSKIPHTLAAMGVEARYAAGTIILSFAADNTVEEVDRFLEVLPGAVARLREMSPGWD